MAQTGPVPISYIPTSRGPMRLAPHAESPLTSLVRRASSRRTRRPEPEQESDQQLQQLQQPESSSQPTTPRIAVHGADGEAHVIHEEDEDDNDDWRADAYNAYGGEDDDEIDDTESAYDYNYTGTPRQSSAFERPYAYSNEAGPSSQRIPQLPPTNNITDNSLRPPPQRLLSNLRIDVPNNNKNGLAPLNSPLLHGDFSRDSLATASESDWDETRSSTMSGARPGEDAQRQSSRSTRPLQFPFQGEGPVSPAPSGYTEDGFGQFGDDKYGEYASNAAQGVALRDSWSSAATGATVRRPDYYLPAEGAGRTEAVVRPLTNFSRPVRESGVGEAAVGERVTPQLPEDMNALKQKVLERNVGRGATPIGEMNEGQLRVNNGRKLTPASSLYSQYSYYQYSSAAPSPTGDNFGAHKVEPAPAPTPTTVPKPKVEEVKPPAGLRTPQDFLQLGIQHHEANRLEESARCFERSAKEDGGCGVGMLMYGLALRHGWGCVKNEKLAFRWLMKAAECAVVDLERLRRAGGEGEAGVVETELVLAIYEVGQCFFHGWGVRKDQKMAVSYYSVAAKLGDGDAQADLGYCLANGKGCKKDKKTAAQWYRLAVGQGQSDLGLGWIYKDKYQ